MNKTLKAADEVKKLHRMFQSLGEVVEVLDRIGSVEQAEQEAIARVEAANRDAYSIKEAVVEANAEAARIVEKAKVFADQHIAEAMAHAGKITAAADAEADRVTTEAAKLLEVARMQVEKAESTVQACAIDVEVKTRELAEIEEKIAKAQAQINKMLGK